MHEPFEVIAKIEIDFSNQIHKLNTEHCSTKCHELMDKIYTKKRAARKKKLKEVAKKKKKTSPNETNYKVASTLANSTPSARKATYM